MASKFYVKIPMPSYLAKFVLARYGNNKAIDIENSNTISTTIYSLLQKPYIKTLESNKAKEITVINYTSYIQCVAPLSLIRDIGFIITNDQVIQFNRFVDDLFEEYLYIFVQKNTKQNQRYCGFKEAIELFAQIHNIEIDVDITFDTLKKAEYRHRKNIEKKLVASLSPQIIKNQVIQQTLFLV